MSDLLQPGDRVLDVRAVVRAGGVFAGLVAAPVATGMSGWWWGWCALSAVAMAVVGFALASFISRVVLPTPPGQTVVIRVGPAALGVALRASMAGGLWVSLVCAVFAFMVNGGGPAAVTLLAGFGASGGAGCLAALT